MIPRLKEKEDTIAVYGCTAVCTIRHDPYIFFFIYVQLHLKGRRDSKQYNKGIFMLVHHYKWWTCLNDDLCKIGKAD